MDIELEPWEVTGPGLLVKKDDATLVHFPDPIRATVTTDAHTIQLVVTIDRDTLRPVVDELHVVKRPGGTHVSADVLRSLGLKDALKTIAERTATTWRLTEDGKSWEYDLLGEGTAPQDAALAFKPTGKHAVPFGEVERAATAYRDALAAGRRDATLAVADALHVSRTTAARRIAKARQAGLLGAPLDRRAGEGRTP
jgi:hypothetical protein